MQWQMLQLCWQRASSLAFVKAWVETETTGTALAFVLVGCCLQHHLLMVDTVPGTASNTTPLTHDT
jgi:hypothetical protein